MYYKYFNYYYNKQKSDSTEIEDDLEVISPEVKMASEVDSIYLNTFVDVLFGFYVMVYIMVAVLIVLYITYLGQKVIQ